VRELPPPVALTLLAVTSGAVDAVSFLAAGKVFSSVITGNLVLLGSSLADRHLAAVLSAMVALAGYCIGVWSGAKLAYHDADRDRRRSPVARALAVEFCLLAGFCAGWEAWSDHLGRGKLAMLVLLAVSMGIQSVVVRRLGWLSTTYVTGVLTGVLVRLATRGPGEDPGTGLTVLAGIVAGAAAAAALMEFAPAVLPVALLGPLAVVLASALAGRGIAEAPASP
jgi:uncharacterized membrane protein YoaK (UPF0700 family)